MLKLVTGATGGLGLSLVDALASAGSCVRATGRRDDDPRLQADRVVFVREDLTDPGAADRLCDGVGTVFHVAALSASWGAYERFHEINVTATARLLEAAQRAGASRFIHVSSPSIYADMRDRIRLTEADDPATPPLNAYARTKLAAERMVLAAARPGFATVSLRPRAIVGPDDRVLAPRLADMVSRGRAPLLRSGKALIELTDVRDVVSALMACDSRPAPISGEALNISGGRPLPMRHVAEEIARTLGMRLRLVPMPMLVAGAVATLFERLAAPSDPEPLLTRYTLATLAYSQTFDLAKAKAAIGFEPRHDGLQALLARVERLRP